MKIKHYIVVRFFNKALGNFLEKDQLSDKLLSMGVKLLELNLLKSLENQTCKNFELILLIHDKLQQFNNDYYQKLLSISQNASFKIWLMTKDQFTILLNQNNDSFDKRIISRVDYDDLLLNIVVSDIQNTALRLQQKPILVYGYNNGWVWRDDTKQLYKVEKLYNFNGHFSVMQSVILDMSSKIKELLKIQPYIWDHSHIALNIDKKYFQKYMQLSFNFNLNAYVWMRHMNTGSINPYKIKADKVENITNIKLIQCLDFEIYFGRKIEINI